MRPVIGMNPVDQPAEDPLVRLEWMLQSGQAGDKALIAALASEYYAQIYTLAVALLGSSERAEAATRQIFSMAVLQADRYSGGGSLRSWIYHLAVKVCLSFSGRKKGESRFRTFLVGWQITALEVVDSNLPQPDSPVIDRDDLPFYLSEVHRLPPDEIALVLEIPEKVVARQLENQPQARQEAFPSIITPSEPQFSIFQAAVAQQVTASRQRKRLLAHRQEVIWIGGAILVMFLLGRMVTAFTPLPGPTATRRSQQVLATRIVRLTATPRPSQTPTPLPQNAIFYTVQEGDTLEKIAKWIGIPLEILVGLNQGITDEPLSPGKRVMIGVGSSASEQVAPTPVTPAPAREPLTLDSSGQAVLSRIYESRNRWHTLWADGIVVDYGPPGYVGPPRVRHEQVWYSQFRNSLVLSGPYDHPEVENVWIMSDGQVYQVNWVTDKREIFGSDGRIDYSGLGELIFPYNLFSNQIQVLGQEVIADRDALVVEMSGDDMWGYTLRMWVDARTGVILRRQYRDLGDPSLIQSETTITNISYDLNLPAKLFEQQGPLPRYFAANPAGDPLAVDWQPPPLLLIYSNARRALPHKPPPPDFDPAGSRLVFQWTRLKEFGAAENRVELFARNYYLGDLPVSNFVFCDRSPDGRLLAFTDWTGVPPNLWWLDLSDLSTLHQVEANLSTSVFGYSLAFAPDSRRLAFISYQSNPTGTEYTGTLHILDVATGEVHSLFQLGWMDALVWKPDGKQIAFLGTIQPNGKNIVGVVDAHSGELVYQGEMLFGEDGKPQVSSDSPTLGWGTPFPQDLPDISNCAEP